MTLVRYNNPTMRSRMMNESINHSIVNEFLGQHSDSYLQDEPRYKVEELDEQFVLELAVPGLSKDDLLIEVENRVLTIETKEREEGDSRKGFAAYEFSKQFRLSRKVNADAIIAKSENGILYLELPKVEQEITKPARAIEIA